MTAGIEKRLATLETKIAPPGGFTATVHLAEPHTFPPGRVDAKIEQITTAGRVGIAWAYLNTESEAINFICEKTSGHRSPVNIYFLQGGGYPPDGGTWQYPEVVGKGQLLPGGKLEKETFRYPITYAELKDAIAKRKIKE